MINIECNNEIIIIENKITEAIENNAKILLSSSIDDMLSENNNISYASIISMILKLQTTIELTLKCYVIHKFGFHEVLMKKDKNKKNDAKSYLCMLKEQEYRTLGFDQLLDYLKVKNDSLGSLKEENGVLDFFHLQLEVNDHIKRFVKMRNSLTHSAYLFDHDDYTWLKIDFTYYLLLVFYNLERALQKAKNENKMEKKCGISNDDNYYAEYYDRIDITNAPIDILRSLISKETLCKLINFPQYRLEIEDLAMDMGETFICTDCGCNSMILNFFDGWSKCFCCGSYFYAGYADCCLCMYKKSVTFDESNIDYNGNALPGFCYNCRERIMIYKCPECGCLYPYDYDSDISRFHSSCCENNYVEKYY